MYASDQSQKSFVYKYVAWDSDATQADNMENLGSVFAGAVMLWSSKIHAIKHQSNRLSGVETIFTFTESGGSNHFAFAAT